MNQLQCLKCYNYVPCDSLSSDGWCIECCFALKQWDKTTNPPTYDHPTVLDVAAVVLVIVVGWYMFAHVVMWIVR